MTAETAKVAVRRCWLMKNKRLKSLAELPFHCRSEIMRKAVAVALLLAVGCSRQATAPSENEVSDNGLAAQAPLIPPAPGEPGGLADDRTPIAEGPIDPKSAQGAGQVLQRYFALLEAGKADEAEELWSGGDTPADFNARLDQYSEVHASIGGPGNMEGAAGSSYVDYPVQLYGRLRNGKEFNARGTMTLRRVNDVPGSTEEQRKWHIYRADFPKKTAADYRFVGRWAANVGNCPGKAWRFTATSLNTPAGSQCTFRKVTEVPGGYDIAARCTAEGPPTDDTLKLRFAESAKALLFESDVIADAGLVRCS
jgi:hypothetical protein